MPRLFAQTHSHDGIVHKFDFDDHNRIIAGDDEGVLRRWDYQLDRSTSRDGSLACAPARLGISSSARTITIVASDTLGVQGWRPEQANAGLIQTRAAPLYTSMRNSGPPVPRLLIFIDQAKLLVTSLMMVLGAPSICRLPTPTEPVDFIRHRDAEESAIG